MDSIDPTTVSSWNKSSEDFNTTISSELLTPSNELSWDLLDLVQEVPKVNQERVYTELLGLPKPIGRTSFRFKRNGISGDIAGYKEELKIGDVDNATSGNSLSIQRKHTSKSEALRGKTSFLPFQPGGLLNQQKAQVPTVDLKFLHRNEVGLFDIPQGLSRGLNFVNPVDPDEDIVDLEEEVDEETEEAEENVIAEIREVGSSNVPFDSSEIDGIVPVDYTSFRTTLNREKEIKRNWAHIVDLDHKIENFEELIPNMARTWPFELDTFQKEAVYHLEQGDSVFVAAHTSAGKTVVAEYAIAMATRNMTKTIYTSPIKALSNQKFRDFKETFKEVDVGLITGDVQINPDANCLIMTTEIIRSMLYRGADLIRDVEFVIFDEVHYVNDIERGVVWEEVIIMLPDHVKYIMLSATVPNTFEFANWVGRTKQKDIYVISTPKRPVPLEIFISAKDSLFKVVDSQRVFNELEFKKHKELLEGSSKKGPPSTTMGSGSRGGPGGSTRGGNRGGGRGGRGGQANRGQIANRGRGNFSKPAQRFGQDGPNKNTWLSLVQFMKNNSLLPAVIFVFSKKKCEMYADTLSSIDFCTAKEKSEIHMFMDRAVSRLKKEDRELPQILKIRDMLSRGIAVHHGGLLPIVKECIEILFARTLVKVLFATETFAMGLNLPTRTVVFSSLRKHDGRGFRNLLPGEFTQMSGRAGRRGLDPTGTVIVMAYNDPLSLFDFKDVTLGTPTKLSSQFRLTYNMILNLLRIEALKVEEMIKHSFSENSSQVLMPENKKKVEELTKDLENLKILVCKDVDMSVLQETYKVMDEYEKLYGEILQEVQKLPTLKYQILKTGRMVCFRDKNDSMRVGFVMKSNEKVMVLTFDHGEKYTSDSRFGLPYLPVKGYLEHMKKIQFNGGLRVEAVALENIHFLCRYALKASMTGILENNNESIQEAKSQIELILRLQNKWEELLFHGATQVALYDLLSRKENLLQIFQTSAAFSTTEFKNLYAELRKRDLIQNQINTLQRALSDENLDLLPDYEQRLEVLETLGFIDEHHNVVLKGRVACEVNSGWELIITELVLDNFLADFDAEEIVALLSCFVYEGRTNDEEPPCITPRLEKGKEKILSITQKLLKVYSDKQVLLTTDEEEFLERKRFALVNVVYEWARGLSFNEIMQISVEAEGTIVRVITRLDEICREVKNAALIVGDSTLHAKMNEAGEKIKRDIVFCASLYL
jgi:antiviral helicase SKI2